MPAAWNTSLLAYHDLGGRPGMKMGLHEADGRFYLYLGSYWHYGWSIVEVTDPRRPRLVRFIEGPANTSCDQMQVADGRMVTALSPFPAMFGGDPDATSEEGFHVWSLEDPEDPRCLGSWRTGANGTHRNYYAGGRYVHAAANLPGFSGEIYAAVDIDDPTRPQTVGTWWWPGQNEAAGEQLSEEEAAKDRTGRPLSALKAVNLHGGPYVAGERAYCPWSRTGMVILDISDVTAPQLVSRLSFYPPLGSTLAVHSVVPLPERGLAIVNSEPLTDAAANEPRAREPMPFVGIVDISDERDPILISLFPTPEPPAELGIRDFADRGGRFGPHNQHQPQFQPQLATVGDLVFLSYFTGGLQIFDISNPRLPRRVGHYVPEDPQRRHGPLPSELVTHCEDVLVDRRGVIYMTERNSGLYIIEPTGELARFSPGRQTNPSQRSSARV